VGRYVRDHPILVTLFQYPIARWAARRQARTMLAAGALLIGLALAVLLPSSTLVMIALAVAILTFGEMLFEPVASAFAADLAPSGCAGRTRASSTSRWRSHGPPRASSAYGSSAEGRVRSPSPRRCPSRPGPPSSSSSCSRPAS